MDQPVIIVSSDEIDDKVSALATHIIADAKQQKPIFVALLRGAAPFASKLMFAIAHQAPEFHPEIDYMMVSTYGRERSASQPEIVTDLSPATDIANRDVIILDDVLDKGITADFVTKHLLAKGANRVKLAVLADKQTKRVMPIKADYACLNVDDVWLAGMGMDDSASGVEHYRWHDKIYQIK